MSYSMHVKVPQWGLLIWSVGPVGLSDILEYCSKIHPLVSSPLFFSFTVLIDSLFCPSHQLKPYSINLTEEMFILCKYNQSLLNDSQRKAICCEMLFNTVFVFVVYWTWNCLFELSFPGMFWYQWTKPIAKDVMLQNVHLALKNKPPSIPKFFQLYHFLWS